MAVKAKIALILAVFVGLMSGIALLTQGDATAQSVEFSVSEVYSFPAPGGEVAGGSTLTRSEDKIFMTLSTSGLDKKSAYSVWWVLFNDPELCSAPGCGEDDIFISEGVLNMPQIEAVNISVLWAAGAVTGTDSTASFSGSLAEGDPPAGLDVVFGNGLADAEGTEVHLVVRSHGHAIPGFTGGQIGSFVGQCDVNECVDQQFAVHQ
jgi:hypothetical protein